MTEDEKNRHVSLLASTIMAAGVPDGAVFCQVSILWEDRSITVARIHKEEGKK